MTHFESAVADVADDDVVDVYVFAAVIADIVLTGAEIVVDSR